MKRIYVWTPELDESLKRIYAEYSPRRVELSHALRAFRTRQGWPQSVVTDRAQKLRLTRFFKYRWTKEEDALLRSMLGARSVAYIAKKLGRSWKCVAARIYELKMSSRQTDGYSRSDLCQVFGVSLKTVNRWIGNGWMKQEPDSYRFSEGAVLKFLRGHSEEYDLKRVDQPWFKGMLFASFGLSRRAADGASRNSYEEVA
jgi:hypothetical protein